MVKRMDEILEAAPSEYCGRLDLIMCAIKKEMEYQSDMLQGRGIESEN
jgi:hypothetical protein